MNKTKNEILNRYDFKTKLAFVSVHSCASGIDLENISIIRNNIVAKKVCGEIRLVKFYIKYKLREFKSSLFSLKNY